MSRTQKISKYWNMKKVFQATQCLSREEINHYLKGDVQDDLRYKIENHLIDCPLCAEAVEGYGVSDDEAEDVFNEIYQKIDTRTSTTPGIRNNRLTPWNRIAAGVLFLLTAGAAYLYYQSAPSKGNYQAYFQNEDNTLALRSIAENTFSPDLAEGIRLYQNKKFQGSLSFFEDYIQINPESTAASYFAGLSALNIGAKENAFNLLSTVRMNDEQLYEEATWVLTGIYLDRGEVDNAKNFLQDLIKIKNGFYVDRAKELLEKLE
ncbi:MAG: hypothetical protein ACI8P3_002162 [Saprospiraceae bacterium]|jgi:hypothetical protein